MPVKMVRRSYKRHNVRGTIVLCILCNSVKAYPPPSSSLGGGDPSPALLMREWNQFNYSRQLKQTNMTRYIDCTDNNCIHGDTTSEIKACHLSRESSLISLSLSLTSTNMFIFTPTESKPRSNMDVDKLMWGLMTSVGCRSHLMIHLENRDDGTLRG